MRQQLVSQAKALRAAEKALGEMLFGDTVEMMIDLKDCGAWDETNQKMRPATAQERADAEYWIRARTEYKNEKGEDKVSMLMGACPDCGADLDGDGYADTDGCAQDWATRSYWSAWCVGAINRDDVECDCDIEERAEASRAAEKICETWRDWETAQHEHPERTWVEPTCDMGQCCMEHPRTCHQGHYHWPEHVVAEFAAIEPFKPENKYHYGGNIEHGADCNRAKQACGWSDSGSEITASGGSF